MVKVPAVAPETDVATAARLMRRLRVHHLPVVEQRQCVGLLGEDDLRATLYGLDAVLTTHFA